MKQKLALISMFASIMFENKYCIYSSISQIILDRFRAIFFQFDLYAGQYLLVLCNKPVNTKNTLLKVHFDIYMGRLIREYIR